MPRQGASAGASASNARKPSAASSCLPSCSAASARKKRGPGACRLQRVRRLEGSARLGGHDAALGGEDGLAEPALPRRRRPEQADGVAVCRDGVLAAAEPLVDRRDHLPALAVLRRILEMRLDPGDQHLDVVRRSGSGKARGERLAGQARRSEAEIKPEREQGNAEERADCRGAARRRCRP